MRKYLILLSFLFVCTKLYAQKDIRVNSFTIEDYLSIDDLIDPDYGRYDAYEINLNKGDYFSIELESNDFWPVFFLSTPSGNNIFKYPLKNKNYVSLDSLCDESGQWNLYIIADTTEVGMYKCKVSFATKDAVKSSITNNFCSYLNSILKHANADFIFMKKNPLNTGIALKGLINAEISNSNYLSVLYSNKDVKNVKAKLNAFVKSVEECGLTIEDVAKPKNEVDKLKKAFQVKSFIVYDEDKIKEVSIAVIKEKSSFNLVLIVGNI